jgi:murein DD-endopeptidase MepM/ murein hydrolase activator NlpD
MNPIQYYLVDGYRITSPYGWRNHPITGVRSFHHGTDLGGKPRYYPLKIPFSGTVIGAAFSTTYGNWVAIISRDGKTVYFFAHLTDSSVKVGQAVRAGEIIGRLGATGSATGVHLHFEIRIHDGTANGGGVWGDPEKYFEEVHDMARVPTPLIIEGITFKAFYDTDEKITYVEARGPLEAVGCKVNYQGSLEKGTIVIPPAAKIVEIIKEVPDTETKEKVRRVIQAVKDLESI